MEHDPLDPPDWRRGVLYWKPTSDGREVGVYPLLWGRAMIYRGPLGDEIGFDESWYFDTIEEAVIVCMAWDGESKGIPKHLTEIFA